MFRHLLAIFHRHRRSRSRMFRERDGTVKSICAGCGAGMVRDAATGRWSVKPRGI